MKGGKEHRELIESGQNCLRFLTLILIEFIGFIHLGNASIMDPCRLAFVVILTMAGVMVLLTNAAHMGESARFEYHVQLKQGLLERTRELGIRCIGQAVTTEEYHIIQLNECGRTNSDDNDSESFLRFVQDITMYPILAAFNDTTQRWAYFCHELDTEDAVQYKIGLLAVLLDEPNLSKHDQFVSHLPLFGECTKTVEERSGNRVVFTMNLMDCSRPTFMQWDTPLINNKETPRVLRRSRRCEVIRGGMKMNDFSSCIETYVNKLVSPVDSQKYEISQDVLVTRFTGVGAYFVNSKDYREFVQLSPHQNTVTSDEDDRTETAEDMAELFQQVTDNAFDWVHPFDGQSVRLLINALRKTNLRSIAEFIQLSSACKGPLCRRHDSVLQSIITDLLSSCGTEHCSSVLFDSYWRGDLIRRGFLSPATTAVIKHIPPAVLLDLLRLCVRDDITLSCLIPLGQVIRSNPAHHESVLPLLQHEFSSMCSENSDTIKSNNLLKMLINVNGVGVLGNQVNKSSIICLLRPHIPSATVNLAIQVLSRDITAEVTTLLLSVLEHSFHLSVRVTAYNELLYRVHRLSTDDPGGASTLLQQLYAAAGMSNDDVGRYWSTLPGSLPANRDNQFSYGFARWNISQLNDNLGSFSEKSSLRIVAITDDLLMTGQTMHCPGCLLPNTVTLGIHTNYSDDLMQLELRHKGFDFTSDLLSSFSSSREQTLIKEALSQLHQQIQDDPESSQISISLKLLGNYLPDFEISNFSFWRQFANAPDFDVWWNFVGLADVLQMFRNGRDAHVQKIISTSLLTGSVGTGVGLTLAFGLDATARLRFGGNIKVQRDLRLLKEEGLQGNGKISAEIELRHSLALGTSARRSLMTSDLLQHLHAGFKAPVSVKTSNRGIQLILMNFPSWADLITTRSSGLTRVGSSVQTVAVAKTCGLPALESFLRWLGVKMCKSHPTQVPYLQRVARLWQQTASNLWNFAPEKLKNLVAQLFIDNLSLDNNKLILDIPFPSAENGSHIRPFHWINSLNDFWLRMRGVVITFPPPSTAMMAGETIRTFDGRLYSIPMSNSGEEQCTYLLAQDKRYTFTVLQGHNAITFSFPEISLTIRNGSASVQINNTQLFADLPIRSWNNKVEMFLHAHTIMMRTSHGLNATCQINTINCDITLDGQLFNVTRGLLGSNDGIAENDLASLPTSDDVAGLLRLYDVTGIPSCREVSVRPRPRRCNDQHNRECADFFLKTDSPLATCFSTISPHSFLHHCFEAFACQNSAHDGHKHTLCDIIRMYERSCSRKGVDAIAHYEHCDACNHDSRESSGVYRLDGPVDIQLVFSPTRVASVTGFIDGLARQLIGRGVTDVRVSLLTGTPQSEDLQSITIDGQIFASLFDIPRLHQTLSTFARSWSHRWYNETELTTYLQQPLPIVHRRGNAIRVAIVQVAEGMIVPYDVKRIYQESNTILILWEVTKPDVQDTLTGTFESQPTISYTSTFDQIYRLMKAKLFTCQECRCFNQQQQCTRTDCEA